MENTIFKSQWLILCGSKKDCLVIQGWYPSEQTKHITINNFELYEFAIINAKDLYGEAEYLSTAQFRNVLKRVIQMLSQHELVRGLACPEHLHIAYAFHEEDMCWIAEVSGDRSEQQ